VAVRGAAHARVVEHFARRFTTVPMKLFTLFTSDERAVAHIQGAERQVRRVLARIAGRQEWGLRVRLDAALARRRLQRHAAPAPPPRRAGTHFLLAKQRERELVRQVLRDGRVAVEDAFASLAGLAAGTRRRPAAELDGSRVVLDAALLVEARRARRFRRAVRRAAATLATRGYRLTLTGPWPPYNFVSDSR
jgi:hypothetical protein